MLRCAAQQKWLVATRNFTAEASVLQDIASHSTPLLYHGTCEYARVILLLYAEKHEEGSADASASAPLFNVHIVRW